MNEQLRSSILAVIMAITVSVLIFSATWVLYLYSKELLLAVLGIVAGAGIVVLVNSYYTSKVKADFQLAELDRYKTRETHPLFYYGIAKNISIQDEKGSAKVDYHMECKNTSNSRLRQIKHEVTHDGKLQRFNAFLNGEDFTSHVKQEVFFREMLEGERRISIKQPYVLRLFFDLTSEKIMPGSEFDYGYAFVCDELYSDMYRKDCEYSGVRINHPTDLLTFVIELPENTRFIENNVAIRVLDLHDVEDYFEEERCMKLYHWSFSRDKRRVTCEIAKPKIACSYRLYFQVNKE